MDRRRFLGALGATAVLTGGGAVAIEEVRMHLALGERRMRSGRAVRLGSERADPSTAQMLWRVNTDRPIVAMTFDDGPDPRYTPAILGLLEDHDTVATFFMQGNHVEAHRDLARQVGERHAIGNHTYTHPNMGSASAAMARDELGRTHEIIERTIGSAPVAFRPPYGSLSGATGMVAADMGYDIVLWSDRMSSRRTPQRNLHALADTVRPGAIVLAHDGGSLPNQAVIDSLPSLLDWFEEKEIELVTVPELVAAESNNGSGYRDRGPSVDPVSDEEPEVATATTIVTTGG